MPPSTPCTKNTHRRAPASFAIALLVLTAAACGSDAGSPDTQEATEAPTQPASQQSEARVTPSDRIFAFDDFKAAGVKHGKDYDVEGLPGATAAVLAFHDRKDVEIRFFPSHDVAVAEGIPVAEEIVGPDVYIKYGSVTWPDAIPDERACAPGLLAGGRDCTRQPRYGGFVVYGNFILFCEAKDWKGALERCGAILERLLATPATD